MSSLAAARADNFYYGPDYRPEDGSLNKKRKGGGEKKSVLTIRFELPFNAWCTSCRNLLGKGVRFNADKRCVGAYHSTKIWSFSMRTPCCGNELEIHTDPAGCAYVIVKGAEQKAEAYDEREAETVAVPGTAEREAARADAFSALEASTRDAGARAAAAPSLRALEAASEFTSKADVLVNKALRRAHRCQRAEAARSDAERSRLGLPSHIPLLPTSLLDTAAAAAVSFRRPGDEHAERRKRLLGPDAQLRRSYGSR